MAREYTEETLLRVTLNAIEDSTPSTVLTQLMVEYAIPARLIAGCVGVSVQTLYQHLDANGAVRLSRQLEPKLAEFTKRLQTLAAEGKLDVQGSARERVAELTSLLAVEEPEQ